MADSCKTRRSHGAIIPLDDQPAEIDPNVELRLGWVIVYVEEPTCCGLVK